ncbi:unnamed protein product [Effrenium voratum]|nr:unnamed protein product [Effrenium voratum]
MPLNTCPLNQLSTFKKRWSFLQRRWDRPGAMVELFEGGPREPMCLMSHWWGHSFMSLVEAILGHASGQVLPSEKLLSEEELEKTYWLCIFGVNQHKSICGTGANPCDCGAVKYLNGHPLCEMDKFGLMMRHFKEHALAADRELETFKRIWVLKELQTALAMGMRTEFCGTITSNISFALLSVREAQASRDEDRRMILAEIEQTMGIDEFDDSIRAKVREEQAKLTIFEAIVRRQVDIVEFHLKENPLLCNVQLRQFGMKTPLHFMAERSRTASEWEDFSGRTALLQSLLDARADASICDASGRSVLHAMCMWDGDVQLAKKLISARADPNERATRGAVANKTPLEVLQHGVSIPFFDRGYKSRSARQTEELLQYLASLTSP